MILNADDKLMVCPTDLTTIADVNGRALYDLENEKETTSRVVACWNACIGIPTEILESTEHGDKPALVTALAQQVAELRGELKTLQQREAP